MKKSNSSFVNLIFEISKLWNVDRSTFGRSKFWSPPTLILVKKSILQKCEVNNQYINTDISKSLADRFAESYFLSWLK